MAAAELAHREFLQDLRTSAADKQAPARQHHQHEDARQDARQEQVINGYLGYHAVQDQGQRRCEQEAEAARRGNEAQVELVRVAVLLQRRVQDGAEGNDRDTGRARERREKRARGERYQRKTARHPAEQRIRQPHETLRRLALAEQVTGECEQRNRRQKRQIGNTQDLERDIHEVGVVALKTQHGAGCDYRKQRCAEDGQQGKNDGERNHCGALFFMPVATWKISRMTDTAKR